MFTTLTILTLTLTLYGVVDAQATARLAIIGDFGTNSNNEAAVASMVRRWDTESRLDAVLTVGDNNYPGGSQSTIENNVGKYYSFFMYPYKSYRNPPLYQGAPDNVNRFFPATGNHDWGDGLKNYLDYYAGIRAPDGTPQNYYMRSFGPVDVFFQDSLFPNQQQQQQWLQTSLQQSRAPWKVVICHHPPFTSGEHGNTRNMQLPYFQWGAHLVISGHDHNYERLFKQVDNCPTFPYVINGLGGSSIRAIPKQEQGSQFKYNAKYGASLMRATRTQLLIQFISVDNVVQDTLTLTKSPSSGCGFITTTAFGAVVTPAPSQPKVSTQVRPPPPPRKLMWPDWPNGPAAPGWPAWPNWPIRVAQTAAEAPPELYA